MILNAFVEHLINECKSHCNFVIRWTYIYIFYVGFTAEDIANQKGQYACSHLLQEHHNKQSGSVASTPRMPSISSRTPTPRQEELSPYGMPAQNTVHGKV